MSESAFPVRLQASVHGRVQGVYFRDSTRQRARQLGVTGWVRNLPDGTVGVLAEGTRPALEALLEYLRSGPPAARVTNVEVAWSAASGEFQGFDVRW